MWRPLKLGEGNDPGRTLWQRHGERLAELRGEDLHARELLAGTAFLHVQQWQRAHDAFVTAARSAEPFTAATASLGLADFAAQSGDVEAAARHYRQVLTHGSADAEAGSALAVVLGEARTRLDALGP